MLKNFKKTQLLLLSLTLIKNAYGVNVQMFSRSNTLTYETLEDARIESSHAYNDYKTLFQLGGSWVESPLVSKTQNNSYQVSKIIKNMYSLHFGGSYYLQPWLMLGATSAITSFQTNESKTMTGIEDLELKGKLRLINDQRFALSAMPTLSIPLGGKSYRLSNTGTSMDGQNFNPISNESFSPGFKLIGEYVFEHIQFVANLGYRFASGAHAKDSLGENQIDYRHTLLSGIGAYIPIQSSWGVNVEWNRTWTFPLFNKDMNPNEIFLGASMAFNKSLHGFVGAGLGNPFAQNDGNDFRLSAGIKFAPFAGDTEQKYEVVRVPQSLPSSEEVKTKKEFFGSTDTAIIRFEHESSTLNKYFPHQAAAFVDKLKQEENSIEKIIIVGFTSKTGNASKNLQLALKRSHAVWNFLLSKGISENLFEIQSQGEHSPVNILDQEEKAFTTPSRENRRVEVKIIMKEAINVGSSST